MIFLTETLKTRGRKHVVGTARRGVKRTSQGHVAPEPGETGQKSSELRSHAVR